MDFLKPALLACLSLNLIGCYYVRSAYEQLHLLSQRQPVAEALKDAQISDREKDKIRLSQRVLEFAENKLKLHTHGNYSTYVKLNRDHVTYVVSAAEKWELKPWLWSFPIVGRVPYKGFFSEPLAKEEGENLKANNLDVYVRGVAAYSTLGWFEDPLLSSMVKMKDWDLVNTLIHESVHATLYIKSNADFNERLAVFAGNWGAEMFYKSIEGENSSTLREMNNENEDEKKFAEFITTELKELEIWYQSAPPQNEDLRQQRLRKIQDHFEEKLGPLLNTDAYARFPKLELNNARLLVYKTYLQDLSKFERLAKKLEWNFERFMATVRGLQDEGDPERQLNLLLEKP